MEFREGNIDAATIRPCALALVQAGCCASCILRCTMQHRVEAYTDPINVWNNFVFSYQLDSEQTLQYHRGFQRAMLYLSWYHSGILLHITKPQLPDYFG